MNFDIFWFINFETYDISNCYINNVMQLYLYLE